MNLLRNPLASGLSTVKSLFRNMTRGEGVFGKSGKESGCIYSNFGVDGYPPALSSRSYGTLRALLPITNTASSPGGILPSMSSSLSSRPLLLNSDLVTGSTLGSSQITPGTFYIQSRGMKFKGAVRRRCKDCFLMWINGMLYNLCKTHPRHKHGLKPAYYVNQRILTHATMSPKRPW